MNLDWMHQSRSLRMLTHNIDWSNAVIRRVLAVGVATATAVIFSASSASAGTNIAVHTTDAFAGGLARWYEVGDELKACDQQADGLRVDVEMTYAGGEIFFQNNDGEGTCRSEVKNLPEGTKVKVTVCLRNGSNGLKVYCKSDTGAA
ncbi:hypothetical protein [Streptomyces sp. NPDC048200]|uniref:hypothetical protein n=1 Tax=Streptomyces sp. NPDC048200 TaxID=3365512 RepID=UPI00371775C1